MNERLDVTLKEGLRLEYKGAAAVGDTGRLARAVAAMLNAEGGLIWIGVLTNGETPSEIEGVARATEERRRLEDALCDLLEPAWSAELGSIEEVPHGDKTLLCVECRLQHGSKPFAVKGRDGRDYLKRVGARVRKMSRDELASAFRQTERVGPSDHAKAEIQEFRRLVTDRKKFPNRFWMLATPASPLMLSDDEHAPWEGLRETMSDPGRSDNRSRGFTVFNRFEPARRLGESIEVGDPEDEYWSLRLDARGTLRFHAPLDVPAFNTPFRQEAALWPHALCELPVSFLRLLDRLYDLVNVEEDAPVLFDMGLAGVRGWKLGPYSPDSVGHNLNARELDRDAIIWSDPLQVSRRDLRDRDKVAMRAASSIYREFGHDGDFLPREWNRQTKRLELPD